MHSVEVLDPGIQLPPDVCQTLFKSRREPLVIRGQLNSWTKLNLWSPNELCQRLGDKTTTFKISPKRGTPAFHKRFGEKEVVFETQCNYVVTTFSNFLEWLYYNRDDFENECKPTTSKRRKIDQAKSSKSPANDRSPILSESALVSSTSEQPSTHTNPLMDYHKSEYWIYADYKYMVQLCEDMPDFLSSVDWSTIGFKDRDGRDSTLWIGSEGANTPCHYDTYGCNFVAQLYGRKKWTLCSPRDTDKLYPTRVPYEESSVFSRVNVADPDLTKYPLYSKAVTYQVTLERGDLLYVPRHWWHYVESIGDHPTVSINTWVDLAEDSYERVKEAVIRTIVSVFTAKEEGESSQWINPNEVLFSNEENMLLLSRVLKEYWEKNDQHTSFELTTTQFLQILTNQSVVDAITKVLTKKS